jgi:hypothetical protein
MSLDGPLRFEGPVECRVDRDGPLALTLTGPRGAEILFITFVGVQPLDLPPRLDAAVIEPAGAEEYRIVSGGERRTIRARRVFVHRDVRQAFCGAVPARRAPVAKRLFWRLILAFAGSSLGRRMLANPSTPDG